MRTAEEITAEIVNLPYQEYTKILNWFSEREWQNWDKQIELDSKGGKLKAMADKALADHAAGRTIPI